MKGRQVEASENGLLALLPPADFNRIAPHLKEVALEKAQVLYPAGSVIRQIYFPVTALVSLLASSTEG